ncbi:MAG: undecaprenyl-diphosphate phosphatase [Anaerolineales bacterium]
MSLIQALVLGIVQGATEFLPISSSAHLVLVPWLLKWEFDPNAAFIFNILVQWGTLLAVVFYFRHDLLEMVGAAWRGVRSRKPFQDSEARLGSDLPRRSHCSPASPAPVRRSQRGWCAAFNARMPHASHS